MADVIYMYYTNEEENFKLYYLTVNRSLCITVFNTEIKFGKRCVTKKKTCIYFQPNN